MQTSPSPRPDPSSLPDPIDQLHLVMEDIETFLTAWLHRVDQISAIETRPDQRLERMILDFEEEKRRWEVRRQREVRDIHDKAQELTRAWLRLEEEQRQFLQSRESRKVAHRHDTPAPRPANREKVEQSFAANEGDEAPQLETTSFEQAAAKHRESEHRELEQREPEQRTVGSRSIESSIGNQSEGSPHQPSIVHAGEPSSLRRASPLQTSPLRESAILQFEQLRREIQTNRQQRRRV